MHTWQVRAGDNGGTKDGGIDSTVGDAQVMVVSILPLPVVNKVRPRMGHVSGGTGITVFGEHFGSEYSRGYAASQYQGVAVYIGEQRCIGEKIISDGAISCTVPAGVGTSDVTVNISDSGQTRGGRLREGYDHSVIYYGGSLTDTKTEYTGYVGMGPRAIVSVASSPFVDASMQVAYLQPFPPLFAQNFRLPTSSALLFEALAHVGSFIVLYAPFVCSHARFFAFFDLSINRRAHCESLVRSSPW
jgi:hypothetical protein